MATACVQRMHSASTQKAHTRVDANQALRRIVSTKLALVGETNCYFQILRTATLYKGVRSFKDLQMNL